ncbi:MAG: hypothetical protein ACE5OZ_02095 [Candidatus Heimdallarchaeota archaeon]
MSRQPEKIELPPSLPTKPGPIPRKEAFENIILGIKARAQQTAEKDLLNLKNGQLQKLEEIRESKVFVYYSWDMLENVDSEKFFEILDSYDPKIKHIDLFILSPGGFSDPAFKIARICQEYTEDNGEFSVLVPHYAKSAATILALGADEIVMGPASELGPIDPQIRIPDRSGRTRPVPLLALRDALRFIKDEIKEDPSLASMYWPQMESVDIMSLGNYNREIESARQYAMELLKARMFKNNESMADTAANKLVECYMDHGYVIDRKEARDNLHLKIVDATPEEWNAMWQLHKIYSSILRDFLARENTIVSILETLELTSLRRKRLENFPEEFGLLKEGVVHSEQ